MNIKYHCTKRENLENILKEGLIPEKPIGVSNAKKGIYLSDAPFDWMYWATEQGRVAGAMLEIDTTDLCLNEDINEFEGKQYGKKYFCEEKIPVEHIVCVAVSTNEKPMQFKELKEG